MRAGLLVLLAACLSACSMDSISRSDEPVTREKAETILRRKLPASASQVYYLFYAGGLQDLEAYLRFHVDPAQANSAIEDILAENNRTMKRSLPYPRSVLPSPQPGKPFIDPANRFRPMAWWQPQTIQNGYFRGENQSYALSVWYDAGRSLVYVYQND